MQCISAFPDLLTVSIRVENNYFTPVYTMGTDVKTTEFVTGNTTSTSVASTVKLAIINNSADLTICTMSWLQLVDTVLLHVTHNG